MAQSMGDSGSDQEARHERTDPEDVRQFLASLSPEEQLLVRVKVELYEGSWDELVADLEARLQGRPYVLKLATRIEDDLARVAKLRRFEEDHGIRLEEFL